MVVGQAALSLAQNGNNLGQFMPGGVIQQRLISCGFPAIRASGSIIVGFRFGFKSHRYRHVKCPAIPAIAKIRGVSSFSLELVLATYAGRPTSGVL